MSNVPPTYDDEIDLLSLLQTIWDGKWKIISIIAVSLLSVLSFNIVKPNTNFTATTEIKPITSSEFDRYSLFNSSLKIIQTKDKEDNEDKEGNEDNEDNEGNEDNEFSIFKITRDTLLNLYIEVIEEGSLLETGIDKFNLINKDDFDSDRDYKEAIEKFASKIKVLKPYNLEGRGSKKQSATRLHHVLISTYYKEDKWKQLLSYVNIQANKSVKNTLMNRFRTIVAIQNQKKNFAIKDLNILIDNTIKDYERNTRDNLAFLSEQAAIARKLGVKKNTIESQAFVTKNSIITSIKTNPPLYLRGYEALDEEIDLIKKRDNKKAFMENLYKLEQQKRALEQNETIRRAEELLKLTPLNENAFKATLVKVAATDFNINNKRMKYYALAIVLGGIIGVFYILIYNAFQNRKKII
jgi:LPS O-antigen subunit length determinant protein (WzzB/FepE family)